MTQSAGSGNCVSFEASLLDAGVPLEAILRTDELYRRPCRTPNHERENRALAALASALAADSSNTILQTLAETILQVTESDSSGLSLLTTEDGGKRFYWPAIAGVWTPHIGGGTPRHFGPCGDVLDCNHTLLFQHFERRYPYLLPVMPPAEECLLVPFYVQGTAVGTIWAIMHDARRKFDAEDERLMNVLGQFASLAYQTLASIDNLKSQVAARKKAEAQLLALTNELETQVALRTQELDGRNRELAEAKARLLAEKLSLERSEAYLAKAQKLSHTGSWHWNVTTQKVFASRELLAIFGFDSEEDRASYSYSMFSNRIHPEDRPKIDKLRGAAIREKRDFEDEFRVLLPGGSIKRVRSIGQCMVSQSGDLEYVGAVMDITDRKRMEESLRQSEEKYRVVVDTAVDAIVNIDEDGTIVYANPSTATIFGYDCAALIGQSITTLMPEPIRETHRQGMQRYLETGRRHLNWKATQFIALRKNGQEFPVEVSFADLNRDGRRVFTAFIRDITERKRSEEAFRQLSGRLLRSQDEERRKIARDLHDSTGQDLVALATMLGQLNVKHPLAERKSRKLLSECKTLAGKCVRQVRTLSYVLHPPILEQAGLMEAIRDYVKGFTQRSGIEVELELGSGFGRLARDVELALFRVVQESLTNVQVHSGSVKAKIRIDRGPDCLTLEISDSGSRGVRDSSKRVPKPAFQFGVGISSMQERVKLVGGHFEIDSTSRGTVIQVTMPLREESEKTSDSIG